MPHPDILKGYAQLDATLPDRNLPDEVEDRPDLLTKRSRELFEEFCRLGGIRHIDGVFRSPETEDK